MQLLKDETRTLQSKVEVVTYCSFSTIGYELVAVLKYNVTSFWGGLVKTRAWVTGCVILYYVYFHLTMNLMINNDSS